jgi:hypothetical protein
MYTPLFRKVQVLYKTTWSCIVDYTGLKCHLLLGIHKFLSSLKKTLTKKIFFWDVEWPALASVKIWIFIACLEVQRIHSIGSQINALNSPFRREKLAIFLYCFSHSNFPPPFSGRAVAWGGNEASNNVLSGGNWVEKSNSPLVDRSGYLLKRHPGWKI